MNKLIVILGPTASGKSGLAVKMARRFYGEIISADSRQIYKGLNIGSGKITRKKMMGIPHHLLDIANPKKRFTVAQYQKLALKKIEEIHKRNLIPFLVGGTGFYIQSVVDGIVIPEVKPDWKLRKKLEQKSVAQLFLMLKKLDPGRAKNIDAKNPRRLIRALEIVMNTGKPVPKSYGRRASILFDILQIGIKTTPEELKKAIQKRLMKRIKGIVAEVKQLHKNGLSWKRLEELGLEYRFTAQYLQGKLSYQETLDKIQIESEHFAKRQMTWFKQGPKIHWTRPHTKSGLKEGVKLCENFLLE